MKTLHGRKSALVLAAAALALFMIGSIQAQGTRPGRNRGTAPAQPAAGQPAAAQPAAAQPANRGAETLDHFFASCLVLENDNEIQAAKLAQSKAENADVKKFAEMMQKDHEKFIKDLERFGGSELRNRGNRRAAGENQTDASRDNARRTATGTAPPANAAGAPAAAPGTQPRGQVAAASWPQTFLQIKEEMAEQCRASTKRELSGKSGDQFDECYMGMQVGAHMKMVDSLIVLERHAFPELQQVLRNGQEVAQKHLDRAKQIMKNLKDEGGEKTASRASNDDSTAEK